MPYADKKRQRKAVREAVQRYRLRQKETKFFNEHGMDEESYNNMIHSMEKDD